MKVAAKYGYSKRGAAQPLQLVLVHKIAKARALEMPPMLLARADEVIE